MTAPRFSAIVVTFHTGPVLDQCVQALLDAPACAQIVLVNNGNPVAVVARLEAQAATNPRLLLLSGHGNIGFGQACNLGARHAEQAHLVFVNPDCVLDSPALDALGAAFATHPHALIGGALRNVDGSEQQGCRRGELTLWSACLSFSGLARPTGKQSLWRDFNRTREPFPDDVCDMPVVSGALMAMARDRFLALGGFDPAFFLHLEDVDLCTRQRQAGGQVLFAPDVTATHIGGTSQVASWRVTFAKAKSFTRYFFKHANGPLGHLAAALCVPPLVLALVLRSMVTGRG
ncbi:MAG: hypothetical protein RL186_328 [Pseudomonadota bacterium]